MLIKRKIKIFLIFQDPDQAKNKAFLIPLILSDNFRFSLPSELSTPNKKLKKMYPSFIIILKRKLLILGRTSLLTHLHSLNLRIKAHACRKKRNVRKANKFL